MEFTIGLLAGFLLGAAITTGVFLNLVRDSIANGKKYEAKLDELIKELEAGEQQQ